MADICRFGGREAVVTPISRPIHDGRLPLAFLQSKAAQRLHSNVVESSSFPIRVACSGGGSGAVATLGVIDPGGMVIRDCLSEVKDEDLFGHGAQLDEPRTLPMGAGGHAAPSGGALQTSTQRNEGVVPRRIATRDDE